MAQIRPDLTGFPRKTSTADAEAEAAARRLHPHARASPTSSTTTATAASALGDNRMLINIGSCQRSQLTVADICTIDLEGNVIEGNGKPPLEFHLHAGDLPGAARRQGGGARASEVVHVPDHGRPELPAGVRAGLAASTRCRCSTRPTRSTTRSMADRLAATLGDRPAAMMKSHGAVTVGKNLVEAFVLANYLEENAYRQYMATPDRQALFVQRRRNWRCAARSSGPRASSSARGTISTRSSDDNAKRRSP